MNSPTTNEKCHESNVPDSEQDIPDGGLEAWLTVIGAFVIQFVGFGFVNAFGVFQAYYSQYHLSTFSPSTISWIGSASSFLVFSGGILCGRLYDRGYFYWLVIGGGSLQAICLFVLSLTQENQFYQVFLCHGLGVGLATSMSYVPSLAVLSQHFEKRRPIVMSMVTSGTPIGTAIYAIMLNNLFNGNLGFANSIRFVAATNTLLLFIGCALMQTRSCSPKPQVNYYKLLSASSAPYISASVGLFLIGAGMFFPVYYIQLDSSLRGLSKDFSFYMIAIMNGGSIIARVTCGFIATRCGILHTLTVATLGSSAVIFAMATASSRAGLASIGFFFGYFSGVYAGLCSPLVAFLTHDISELGARLGITLFVTGLGSLIGSPLAGALLGSDYIWWRPAVFCGCLNVASAVMFVIALISQRKSQSAPADA